MKIIKNPGPFRIVPTCCAIKCVGDNKFVKTNWLWLNWMFIIK